MPFVGVIFYFRKDWIRILVLKTFAITIVLQYNNDNTLKALQRLTTVSLCTFVYIIMYIFSHLL